MTGERPEPAAVGASGALADASGAAAGAPDPAAARAQASPEPDATRGWWDPRGWRWWVQTLAVYAGARAFTTIALLVALGHQYTPNYWMPGSGRGSYWQFTGLFWDADWYRQIAESGYPSQLPVGADGNVAQNPWAFFPLFPMAGRLLMRVTGQPWQVVAPLLSLALGAAAMVVIHRLVERGAPRAVAARPGLPLATVLLVSVFPTAVVLQVAYTESLALLLVASALLLLVQRRYLATAGVVVLLGFTRAVALPMAVVVVVHAVVRWRDARHGRDRLGARDAVGLGALAAAAAVSGVAWLVVTSWVTGRRDAYLQTQEAWRGVRSTAPFEGWGYVTRFWFGGAAPWVVLASVALVVVVLVVPAAWRLGNELHTWAAAYVLYIAAAVEPGSSLARFLLLAFPMGAVTAGVVARRRARRAAWLAVVAVTMLGLQLVWIWNTWRLTGASNWPP